MTPDDRDRYLAAYEAVFPGDIDGRSEDERDTIADQLYEVEHADDIEHAAWLLAGWDYHYGAANAPDLCRASARALRAALGIVDRPEPPTASDLAARLREVERERDEARAERDRLQAILDAERGVRGREGWKWWNTAWWRGKPRAMGSVRVSRGVNGWDVWAVGTPDISRYPTALDAMEAADAAAKEEG